MVLTRSHLTEEGLAQIRIMSKQVNPDSNAIRTEDLPEDEDEDIVQDIT